MAGWDDEWSSREMFEVAGYKGWSASGFGGDEIVKWLVGDIFEFGVWRGGGN